MSEAAPGPIEPYDSTADTLAHIRRVNELLLLVAGNLIRRAVAHDRSKLEPPEKEAFDRWTPVLRATTYGTPEYEEARARLGPALNHHYRANDHHPEHFHRGIEDMNLMQLVEMACDWLAAAEAREGGKPKLGYSAERYGIDAQLESILAQTLSQLAILELMSDGRT